MTSSNYIHWTLFRTHFAWTFSSVWLGGHVLLLETFCSLVTVILFFPGFLLIFRQFFHSSHHWISSGIQPRPSSFFFFKLIFNGVYSCFVTPWAVACQAPLPMGFSRQEYWSGLLFLSLRDLPDPGIEPGSPALQAVSLPTELWGKPNSWLDYLLPSN